MFASGGREASAAFVASSRANSISGFCEYPVPIACGDAAVEESRSELVAANFSEMVETFGAMMLLLLVSLSIPILVLFPVGLALID